MRMRSYSRNRWVALVCVVIAVVGGLTAILNWFFVTAYVFGVAVIGAYFVYCGRKVDLNRIEAEAVLQIPPGAFLFFLYVFLAPWAGLPLEFDTFSRLAPIDRPLAAVIRAILCIVGFGVTTSTSLNFVRYQAASDMTLSLARHVTRVAIVAALGMVLVTRVKMPPIIWPVIVLFFITDLIVYAVAVRRTA